jgi:hypothetical protein
MDSYHPHRKILKVSMYAPVKMRLRTGLAKKLVTDANFYDAWSTTLIKAGLDAKVLSALSALAAEFNELSEGMQHLHICEGQRYLVTIPVHSVLGMRFTKLCLAADELAYRLLVAQSIGEIDRNQRQAQWERIRSRVCGVKRLWSRENKAAPLHAQIESIAKPAVSQTTA